MKTMKARKGFALVTAMVLMGSALIAVSAVVGYVAHTTRMISIDLGNSVCRFAAQSEIELAKSAINGAFSRYLSSKNAIIGGDTIGRTKRCTFDWFQSYTGESVKRSIGVEGTIKLDECATNNGCVVKVRIGRVDHTTGNQWADVTLIAQAKRVNKNGTVSSATIQETVRFAQQRSKVFNNAYFVNNYGWFQGSGCTANGEVRANGDMYLDSSCKINGLVHAAKNEELGVSGTVTNSGKMDNATTYRSSTYGVANMSRPLFTDPKTGEVNAGGYDAPASTTTAVLQGRVYDQEELSVEMPYIGDLNSETSDYRQWAKELNDADPNMATIKQGDRTIASVYYNGVGPSGVEGAADQGALVLTGTAQNPIVINGPVIVASDVIISGYVTGQGTIYSGRNIHIVGNVQYVKPPTWSGKSTSGSDNASKDMLGLMAKGNIVMGDYSDSSWLSSIKTYLTSEPYVQKYACDATDAEIGYPSTFAGSYVTQEYVGSLSSERQSVAVGGYDSSSGRFGKVREQKVATGEYTTTQTPVYDWRGRITGYRTSQTPVYRTEYYTSYDRRYYESVCPDSVISGLCANNGSSITRIDAVLYNNHGIFGKLGKCTINGSLVCRNEGLQYSSNLYLNWDIRLFSNSAETVDNDKVGLAKASDNPPKTIAWRLLPQGVVDFSAEESSGD